MFILRVKNQLLAQIAVLWRAVFVYVVRLSQFWSIRNDGNLPNIVKQVLQANDLLLTQGAGNVGAISIDLHKTIYI